MWSTVPCPSSKVTTTGSAPHCVADLPAPDQHPHPRWIDDLDRVGGALEPPERLASVLEKPSQQRVVSGALHLHPHHAIGGLPPVVPDGAGKGRLDHVLERPIGGDEVAAPANPGRNSGERLRRQISRAAHHEHLELGPVEPFHLLGRDDPVRNIGCPKHSLDLVVVSPDHDDLAGPGLAEALARPPALGRGAARERPSRPRRRRHPYPLNPSTCHS